MSSTNGHHHASHRLDFEAFGVPISVEVPSPLIATRVLPILPPGWQPAGLAPEENRFELSTKDGVSYRVVWPARSVSASSDIDVALAVLDTELRQFIAHNAPEHVFVHAGVVAHEGRAIMIPGPSFSGKTSLVAAFVRAGAVYYSDEYAVLDADGLVHPYAKPLSIRLVGFEQTDHDVALLGGTAGAEPIPIGSVLLSQFREGASWSPRTISSGEGVLAVLSNTLTAQERPEESLSAIKRALDGALIFEGERGEAAQTVEDVLHNLRVSRLG
jgi:hypothetical protein